MDMQVGMLSPMTTQRARGVATAADIAGDRQEVIRGQLVEKASPSFEHGSAQSAISGVLVGFRGRARKGRPGGWWLGVEVEIELQRHEVYVPDLAGWRIDRFPEPPSGKPVRVTPDWVCEVLSPSTMTRDLGHKQRIYHQAGVGHYWVIEPMDGVLWVYRWTPEAYMLVITLEAEDLDDGDLVRIEPFDVIGLDLADIFHRSPHQP
jgi:Uma2 family endonuclease